LASDVPVYPVTLEIARLAGRIEGQQGAKGVRVAFEDLLIGATAMHLGYNVATLNVRDFQRVPGLSVVRVVASIVLPRQILRSGRAAGFQQACESCQIGGKLPR
jgi:hypothetical protein